LPSRRSQTEARHVRTDDGDCHGGGGGHGGSVKDGGGRDGGGSAKDGGRRDGGRRDGVRRDGEAQDGWSSECGVCNRGGVYIAHNQINGANSHSHKPNFMPRTTVTN